MTIREVFDTFASRTSMHGIPNVIGARSSLNRLFWSLICCAAGIMVSMQISVLLTRYLDYPKKVTVEVVRSPSPFPSISICNMRNLDFSILNSINKKFIDDPYPINHINTSTDPFVKAYMLTVAKYGPLWYTYQEQYPEIFQEVFSRTTFAANIPQDIVSSAAVQLNEFVVNCYLAGKKCNMKERFKNFFDPYYYNCFTYTPQMKTVADLNAKKNFSAGNSGNKNSHESTDKPRSDDDNPKPVYSENSNPPNSDPDGKNADIFEDEFLPLSEGIEAGWSAIVFSGNGIITRNEEMRLLPGLHEPKSPVASSEGIRVVIHPPDTEPFPFAEGFDVPPGFSVSFGIRPRKNLRIKAPYGKCHDRNPFDPKAKRYRAIACQKMCLQVHILNKCGCLDAALPKIPGKRSAPNCRQNDDFPDSCMHNSTEKCLNLLLKLHKRIRCVRDTKALIQNNATLLESCNCHPPCKEIYYDISYSLSKWPASGYEGDAAYYDIFHVERFKKRFEYDLAKYNVVDAYFSSENRSLGMLDFARLNVYIADSNVITTSETADYLSTQLVSDIGGQLGLWVGISVITISEVFQLICSLVSYMLSAERPGRDSRHRSVHLNGGVSSSTHATSGAGGNAHSGSAHFGSSHSAETCSLTACSPPASQYPANQYSDLAEMFKTEYENNTSS